jgi:hypothetical protein
LAISALLAVAPLCLGGAGGDKGSPLDREIRRMAEEAPLALRFQGGTAKECLR